MVSDTVCPLSSKTWAEGGAEEVPPVVLVLCPGPWPVCFGLLGYMLVGELLVIHKWSEQLDGEMEGRNEQKEQMKGGSGKAFYGGRCVQTAQF